MVLEWLVLEVDCLLDVEWLVLVDVLCVGCFEFILDSVEVIRFPVTVTCRTTVLCLSAETDS